MSLTRAAAALLCIFSFGQAWALPEATPEELGLSRYAIAEFLADFQRRIDRKEVPGAVLLIARDGKVGVHAAVGYIDRDKRLPMRTDAIFSLASMTKPITAAAVMALADAGKLNLGDPVSKWLPEFRDLRVGMKREAARREITILDLLRHTAGLGYSVEPLRAGSLSDMSAALAKLPLKHQPGSTWDYSIANDLLGRVIEVASGLEMDDYVLRRLTEPLGMHDTGFWVDAEKADRLAQPARAARSRPRFFSGGAGMVSTAMDYAHFCQMLLDGGVFDDLQVLSKESAEAMTSDQLPATIRFAESAYHLSGGIVAGSGTKAGYGLGFGVQWREEFDGAPRGEFWWVGDSGVSFVVNVEKRLIAILLTRQPDQFRHYLALLRRLARAVVVR
jgi:CubicO group peptidase (beta-lactamase class C family)